MPLPSTILYPASGGGGGAGNVIGPGSSTDKAIARWSGTGGDTLQDSAVTIADTTGSITTTTTGQYLWSTDTGLARSSAGVVKVTDGSTGSGSILVTTGSAAACAVQVGAANVGMYNGGSTLGFAVSGSALLLLAGGEVRTSTLNVQGNTMYGFVRQVEANTAGSGSPNILVNTENSKTLTNQGATAQNYHTLPTAVAGYNFTFICQDSDGIRVTANTGDTIRVIDKVTAAAGYIESTTIGSVVRLIAINSTEWVATSIHGVWTDGTFTYDDTGLTSP